MITLGVSQSKDRASPWVTTMSLMQANLIWPFPNVTALLQNAALELNWKLRFLLWVHLDRGCVSGF